MNKYLLTAFALILCGSPAYAQSTLYSNSTTGDVGIGTASPVNPLDIYGQAVIGTGYAGVDTAPSNGLLVQGDVGIGTATQQGLLTVYGASTVASAASAKLDYIALPAATTTITGTTNITTAKGFNATSLYQPTYTDTSAVTITNAGTLYVDNAPAAAGSVTITHPWAISVGAGNVSFPGTGNALGTITSGTWNGSPINLSSYASGTLQAAQFPALTGDVTTSSGSLSTTVAKIQGTTVSGTTGTGNVVFSASPTLTGTVTGANSNWSGSVGIGTSSPQTTLDVHGGVHTGSATTGASCSGSPEGTFAYDMTAHSPVYCSNTGLWTSMGGGGGPATPTTSSGPGNWETMPLVFGPPDTVTLPSGGTWAWFYANNQVGHAGVSSGGTVIFSGTAFDFYGFIWRVQ